MRKSKNWEQSCPNSNCSYYRRINRGNIRSVCTYMTKSGKRRIFQCNICQKSFAETRDTVFFGLKTPEEKVMMALKMILVKVDLSSISFVLDVKEETVLEWLKIASEKAEEINEHLMKEIKVTQVQFDEMWNFIERKHSIESEADRESKELSEDGRQWIWVSFASEFRLILLTLIQMTMAVIIGIPCFFSDGFSSYLPALIECYHKLTLFPRTGRKGRPKAPIKEPHPDIVYA